MAIVVGEGAQKLQGRATRLVPPVVLDGVEYGWGLKLEAHPANEVGGRMVVSGIVHSVSQLSGNRTRLVMERGVQMSSYVVPPLGPGGGSSEVPYGCSTGGNIANSRERERVFSRFNGMARRGSLASERVVPADGAEVVRGQGRHLLEVVSATAYGEAPEEVNFVPSGPANSPVYVVPRRAGLGVDADGVPAGWRVTTDAPGLEWGVALWDGSSATVLTRRVFEDDEDLLPADAVLDAGEFWWDPAGWSVRLWDGVPEGDTAILAAWLVGEEPAELASDREVAAIADGEGIVDFEGWSFGGQFWRREFGEWSEVVNFLGPGALVVARRVGENEETVVVRVEEGGVTVARWTGAAWVDATEGTAPGSVSFAGAVEVLVERDEEELDVWVGGDLVFSTAAGPTGPLVVGVCPLVRLSSTRFFLGGASRGVMREPLGIGDYVGRIGALQTVSEAVGARQEFAVEGDWEVTGVVNESAGAEMALGVGRSGYQLAGGVISFRGEAEGDRIRVDRERTGPGPTPPGRPPRTFDQPGFATFDPEDPELATKDVNENRANWRDVVVVHNPLGVTIVPGDAVSFWRGRGFAPGWAGAEVAVDARGDEGTDWEDLAQAEFRLLAYEGILLLRGGLELAEEFCVRVDLDSRYRRSGHPARYYNELAAGIGMLDAVWCDPRVTLGGQGLGVSGRAWMEPGPEGFVEHAEGEFRPTDFVWGVSRQLVNSYRFLNHHAIDGPVALPYYHGVATFPGKGWHSLNLDTPARANTSVGTPSADYLTGYEDQWERVKGEIHVRVDPFEAITEPDPTYFFGSPLLEAEGIALAEAVFRFRGRRIDFGALIGALPEGATIVRAEMPVKFTNLEAYEWTYEVTLEPGETTIVNGTVNGQVHWDGSDQPVGPLPAMKDRVQMTFDCVALRRDTARIVDVAGEELELPRSRFVSRLGALDGGRSEVITGEWSMVNVTRLFRAALGLVDSLSAYDGYELWPTVGTPSLDADEDELVNYALGLLPARSMAYVDLWPGGTWRATWTLEGKWVQYDQVEVGLPLVRYRLPSGEVRQEPIPGVILP